MEKWNNLKKYFGSKFDCITFLEVILYVDIPLIVTFIANNKSYIGYLYKLDDSNLNAYWLISTTTNKNVLSLVKGDISVHNIMINNNNKCYYFSVEDGKSHLSEKKSTDFEISSDFYIRKNIPNEIDLLKVINSLTAIELQKKQYTDNLHINDFDIDADADYLDSFTDKVIEVYKDKVQYNIQSETHNSRTSARVIKHKGWNKVHSPYLYLNISDTEFTEKTEHVEVKYNQLKEVNMTVEENIYVES